MERNTERLGLENLPEILQLEKTCFQPMLQANEDTLRERFVRGHTMLGMREEGKLAGMISYALTAYNPKDTLDAFPTTFREFWQYPSSPRPTSAFVYNLEVVPARRDGTAVRVLVLDALQRIERAGCKYAFADGRCSSYNGSHEEHIPQDVSFRSAIDTYLAGGQFPSENTLERDGTLLLYKKLAHCTYWRILPDFIPEDTTTDGIRVICRKDFRVVT